MNECPICEGIGEPLGELGGWLYFRCRYCGWDFRERAEPEDDGDDYVCCEPWIDILPTDPFGER